MTGIVRTAVLLLSGGLDSAAALHHLVKHNVKVQALFLDYGQRNCIAELDCVNELCARYKVNLTIMNLSLRDLYNVNMLMPSADSPDLATFDQGYVPARNLIFASLGVSLAENMGYGYVALGLIADQYSPDASRDFLSAINQVARFSVKHTTGVIAPLIHKNKIRAILDLYREGFDFSLTTSCWTPDSQGKPCDLCHACIERGKAFAAAGVEDNRRTRFDLEPRL